MVDLAAVFARLEGAYGPQHWWPAETRFEVIVGALLMAQTSWSKVTEAIANLKRAGVLTPQTLAAMPIPRLRAMIRPAGLYRTKPRRLRGFCQHLVQVADGDLDRFFARDFGALRRELLSLDGVGPETADSILLYAGRFPTFVVDAYTVRFGRRMGWFPYDRYDSIKAFFETRLRPDRDRYGEFHALIVAHGKRTCRARPLCARCPVNAACAFYAGNEDKRSGRGKIGDQAKRRHRFYIE